MVRQGRTTAGRSPRVDAVRNRALVVAAARDVFVERGVDAPLDEVARRAGVGTGTLYRHFPDRRSLLVAVVLDALTTTQRVADEALSGHADPFQALAAYMHAMLDQRVAAVIPLALGRVDFADPHLRTAREDSALAMQRLIDAAHEAGTLAPDVTFADIGMMLVRLSRPLPGPMPAEMNDRLAHRHLDLLVEGLRPHPTRRPPAGPTLNMHDLRDLDTASG